MTRAMFSQDHFQWILRSLIDGREVVAKVDSELLALGVVFMVPQKGYKTTTEERVLLCLAVVTETVLLNLRFLCLF